MLTANLAPVRRVLRDVATTPVQLVRQALSAPDPQLRLRAIAELRAELEELETDAVRSAVDAGSSWSQVAGALGVSKQSAHKRFARAIRERPPSDGLARLKQESRRVVVAPGARHAVQAARAAARSLGHPEVQTSHLLLGLLADPTSPAARAMDAIGVRFNALHDVIAERHPGRAADTNGGGVPISAGAQAALERSLRETQRLGHSHLGGEHLLLGIVRDTDEPAAAALHALDISPVDLERCLGKMLMEASFEAP